MLQKDIIEIISKYDVISFDIFDTILIRPYVKPTDLFRHIEADLKISGFYKERTSAERRARKKINKEISLDEIYEVIDSKYFGLKETELEYEKQVLQVNPEIKSLFDYCIKNGKRVIFISDMYLSSSFIIEVMHEKGIVGFDKVYVSNEYRKSKIKGDLYDYVIADMNLSKDRIVHIGDNSHSDHVTPNNLGIESILYVSPIIEYLSTHKEEYHYFKRKRNLDRSVIVSMDMIYKICADYYNAGDYWYNIGYRFGGPSSSAFTKFIESSVEDESLILFVSRDGYNLQNVYHIMASDEVDFVYVYAPRLFSVIFGNNSRSYEKYSRMILEHYAGLEITYGLSDSECTDLFNDNYSQIKDKMERDHCKYKAYIEKIIGDHKKLLLVDVTTMRFSSQKLIEGMLDSSSVKGCYYNVMSKSNNPLHSSFKVRSKYAINWTNVNLLEFFMNSIEGPINDITDDGQPLFSDITECEKDRINIYDRIMQGENDYATRLKAIFGDYIPNVSSDSIDDWNKILASNKDKDNKIRFMKWAPDVQHKDYRSLVFNNREIGYLLRMKVGSIIWKMKVYK